MNLSRIYGWLCVLTTLALAACAVPTALPGDQPENEDREATGVPASLEGSEWILSELEGQSPVEGTQVTLEFEGGRAGGFSGCNRYGVNPVQGEPGELRMPEIESTLVLCTSPEGVMDQEAAYFQALQSVTSYQVDGERLEMMDEAGTTVLVFTRKPQADVNPADLVGSGWLLNTMNGSEPVEGSRITLVFTSGEELEGLAGCRSYTGAYQAEGDDLTVHQISMVEIDCLGPEALREREAAFIDSLSMATDVRLQNGRLEILTAPGAVLVFDALSEGEGRGPQEITWVLAGFEDGEGRTPALEGVETSLVLENAALEEQGVFAGSAGCNSYSAEYTFDGSFLTVAPPVSTKKACSDPVGIMEQETRFLTYMGDVVLFRIDGDQLRLESDDGRALIFQAR